MQEGMQVTKAMLDKHNLMKQEWFEEFQLKFSHIVKFLNTVPLPQSMRVNGYARADEFYFWIREGIANIQMMLPPEPKAPESPCEPAPTTPPTTPDPTPECEPEKPLESSPLE